MMDPEDPQGPSETEPMAEAAAVLNMTDVFMDEANGNVRSRQYTSNSSSTAASSRSNGRMKRRFMMCGVTLLVAVLLAVAIVALGMQGNGAVSTRPAATPFPDDNNSGETPNDTTTSSGVC